MVEVRGEDCLGETEGRRRRLQLGLLCPVGHGHLSLRDSAS
jgi:hypothetical protein